MSTRNRRHGSEVSLSLIEAGVLKVSSRRASSHVIAQFLYVTGPEMDFLRWRLQGSGHVLGLEVRVRMGSSKVLECVSAWVRTGW